MSASSPVPVPATDILIPCEAAAYLRVAEKTLTNWRCRSVGPRYLKIGGIILYRRSDLDAFLEASLVDPVLKIPRRKSLASGQRGGHA